MDSPDTLANLIALVDQYAVTTDEWETEVILRKLRETENAVPSHLKRLAHFAVEGALFVRRQSDLGRKNGGAKLARNINMAAECINLRRDSANNHHSDAALIEIVRVRPRYNLGKSAARSAILDGLKHPSNLALLKKFGEPSNPNKPRSIFDGSKRTHL